MKPRRRAPLQLLKRWKEVAELIRGARRIALYMDFDGTLAPVVPMPADARIPAATKRILRGLLRDPRVSLTVISGRRRNDLKRRVSVRGLRCLGLYGWERSDRQRGPGAAMRELGKVFAELKRELKSVRGVWIENKVMSLSIHFRRVSAVNRGRAQLAARRALASHREHLQIEENLRDWEVLPRVCGDKGASVRSDIAKRNLRSALAIYIGDDISDEAAFRALTNGITIHVGAAKNTRAKYRVPNPAAVAQVLARMKEVLQ